MAGSKFLSENLSGPPGRFTPECCVCGPFASRLPSRQDHEEVSREEQEEDPWLQLLFLEGPEVQGKTGADELSECARNVKRRFR